jgi:hypothetical protein
MVCSKNIKLELRIRTDNLLHDTSIVNINAPIQYRTIEYSLA